MHSKYKVHLYVDFVVYFKYRMNSKGPRIEHWGTPHCIFLGLGFLLFLLYPKMCHLRSS